MEFAYLFDVLPGRELEADVEEDYEDEVDMATLPPPALPRVRFVGALSGEVLFVPCLTSYRRLDVFPGLAFVSLHLQGNKLAAWSLHAVRPSGTLCVYQSPFLG